MQCPNNNVPGGAKAIGDHICPSTLARRQAAAIRFKDATKSVVYG